MCQSERASFACTLIGSLIAMTLGRGAPALAAPVPSLPAPAEPQPPAAALEPIPAQPVPPPPPPVPAVPVIGDGFKLVEADVGTRLALRLQDSDSKRPNRLNDVGMNGRVELLLSGQANSFIRWQADFIGTFGTGLQAGGNDVPNDTDVRYDSTGSAAVLDLIGQLDLHEAINLWVGRMLVPADRTGLSTEWFIAPWLLPGLFFSTTALVGSHHGPYGRSDGATLWGQFAGGAIKYYLGVYNLADPLQSPLYSGRLGFSLLNPEPGYANASTYYGSKDILALGLGFQYQRHGSLENDSTDSATGKRDFTELNVDLLFEKNLGLGGVVDIEGAFYRIWGAYEKEKVTFFVLASYLLPIAVGPGRFQPLFRLQQAAWMPSPSGLDDLDGTDALADGQLGYIIDGHRIRLALDYQYGKVRGQSRNAVLFGLQLRTR